MKKPPDSIEIAASFLKMIQRGDHIAKPQN
jgi:hypothetical protein